MATTRMARGARNLVSIARKELIPIVMAYMLWGNKWWRKAVRVHCDNEAVVEVLQKGCARDVQGMAT